MTRKPDLIFEAICQAVGYDHSQLLSRERGMANKAAKEFRDAGVEPAEITRRSRIAHERWGMPFTPDALVRNWALLDQEEPRDEEPDSSKRYRQQRRTYG